MIYLAFLLLYGKFEVVLKKLFVVNLGLQFF